MKITRETDHAVKCVQYLCKYPDQSFTVSVISEKSEIPKAFLAKIIQKLAKAGIVRSIQGAQGGFTLARQPVDITMKEIVEIIQGPIVVNPCLVDESFCSRTKFCKVHPVWNKINKIIAKELEETDFSKLS